MSEDLSRQQLIDLAEKYEAWASQDGMPAPLVEEYRACAAGLRLLAAREANEPDRRLNR